MALHIDIAHCSCEVDIVRGFEYYRYFHLVLAHGADPNVRSNPAKVEPKPKKKAMTLKWVSSRFQPVVKLLH